MKQIVGIRFSEHGQVQVCAYEVPEGAPLLAPAVGVMVPGEYGLTFGRVAWQHLQQISAHAQQEGSARLNLAAYRDEADEGLDRTKTRTTKPESSVSLPVFPPGLSINHPEEDAPRTPDHAQEAALFSLDPAHGDPRENSGEQQEEALPLVRAVTEEELVVAVENESISREARVYCRRCITDRRLDMKLVDVETLFDRSKMIFYFTAPTRIDFRELVKDLVRQYRTRIELRQIGVRHETQMLGALGNCGMVCCCRRYLRKFAPVTIKMAKEQNLFLNPAKISGICGRLLCCLSYEQENYDAFHRNCPKLGKRYQTINGPMRVLRGNMFRNTVMVLPDNGQELEFTLDEWQTLEPRRSELLGPVLAKENHPVQELVVVSAAPDTLDADLADLGLTDVSQKATAEPVPPATSEIEQSPAPQDEEQEPDSAPATPQTTGGDARSRRRRRRKPGTDKQKK